MRKSLSLLLLLAACTSQLPEGDDLESLRQLTLADLRAAQKDAEAHKDIIGATCWKQLAISLEGLSDHDNPIIGIATAHQTARNIRRRLEAGVPEEIRLACAALVDDGSRFLIRLARRIAL